MQGFILRAEALRSSQISREDQRAITHRVVRLEPASYDLKSKSVSNTPSRANVIYDLLLRPLFFLGGGGGMGRAKSRGGTYSVHNNLELEANRPVLKQCLVLNHCTSVANPIRPNAQLFSLNWLDPYDFNTFFDKCVQGMVLYQITLVCVCFTSMSYPL